MKNLVRIVVPVPLAKSRTVFDRACLPIYKRSILNANKWFVLKVKTAFLLTFVIITPCFTANAHADSKLEYTDLFNWKKAADPRWSPDGNYIAYAEKSIDSAKNKEQSAIWIFHADGNERRKITTNESNDTSPEWSKDGQSIYFLSNRDGYNQVFSVSLDTQFLTKVSSTKSNIVSFSLSPDGKNIAFVAFSPDQHVSLLPNIQPPEGADWAAARPKIKESRTSGKYHLFVKPLSGGAQRQLTNDDVPYAPATPYLFPAKPSWSADSKSLVFSSVADAQWDGNPYSAEIYQISIDGDHLKKMTHRGGFASEPIASPDGKKIAFLGFDGGSAAYQTVNIYLMDEKGAAAKALTTTLDRSAFNIRWSKDSQKVYFSYTDGGHINLASVATSGEINTITSNLGSDSSYNFGEQYDIFSDSRYVITYSSSKNAGNLAVGDITGRSPQRMVTSLNADIFERKAIAKSEEIQFTSFDGRKIQGWILKPADFDPNKKYPLILDIHGGPFLAYGDRFDLSKQLMVAQGYVLVLINPRGSVGYGDSFANLIQHRYPGDDHHDLMAAVDFVVDKGYVDTDNLFIFGSSGGGLLTCWAIGNTDRFSAAVAYSPVINWNSFVLTTDVPKLFVNGLLPGPQWKYSSYYTNISPISLVDNAKTPTMLVVGEQDTRVAPSEAEQYHQALILRNIESILIRFPEATHVYLKPSQRYERLIYTMAWFEKHRARADHNVLQTTIRENEKLGKNVLDN